jgi:hypothetical protein
MWLILQSGIIFAVQHPLRWTPNGYLEAGLGILPRMLLLLPIGRTVDRLRRHA